MKREILRMDNISKRINNIVLLNNINFNLLYNEIVVLLGVNGAGKTLLIKALSGIIKIDSGSIFIEEKKVKIDNPYTAKRLGIHYVYSEIRYIEDLSVMENMFLGNESSFFINKEEQINKAEELLSFVGLKIDPARVYKNLSIAKKKLIEIASVLNSSPRLIIIDEPQSSFSESEKDIIRNTIIRLKNRGISTVLTTRDVKFAVSLADRIAVIRSGVSMGIYENEECSKKMLIALMTGSELTARETGKNISREEVLKVDGLSGNSFKNISFSLYKGEILGLAGSQDSGKTSLLEALFGLVRISSGRIYIKGIPQSLKNPADAIKNKIGFAVDDLGKYGFVNSFSIRENISLPSIKKVSTFGVIKNKLEEYLSDSLMKKLFETTFDMNIKVDEMSNINKQKLILLKWLSIVPDIILIDMSLISLDTDSINEIYKIIDELASGGISFIFTSSDVEKTIAVSDRILILKNGVIIDECDTENIRPGEVVSMMY